MRIIKAILKSLKELVRAVKEEINDIQNNGLIFRRR